LGEHYEVVTERQVVNIKSLLATEDIKYYLVRFLCTCASSFSMSELSQRYAAALSAKGSYYAQQPDQSWNGIWPRMWKYEQY